MRTLLAIALLPLLTACGTKQYYEQQPARDMAEASRIAQISDGYKGIAQALFAPQSRQTEPQIHQKSPTKPCYSCGGDMGDIKPTEAVVHLGYDASGQVVPERVEFKDAASDHGSFCPQDDPCFENGQAGQAPVEGTGVAASHYPKKDIYQISETEHQDGVPISKQYGGRYYATTREKAPQSTAWGGPESLLLQYIFAEKQADAEQRAAEEKTKQVQAIIAGYTQAILKPQAQQAAPFDPTNLGIEAIRQTPLGMAIWGLQSVGKARGNTTATMSNGSAMSQEGATAGGGYSAPVTTTKITEFGSAE